MKKRIYLALIILIAFLSIGLVSASEVSVNDTYTVQDSSMDLLSVENDGVGSDSNNLSTNNADTNLNDNTIGASESAKKAVIIDAPDINLYFKNGTRFVATLSDIDGNKLANQTLIFSISGVNYTRTTDNEGQASIAINLNPNNYNFIVYYGGSEEYLDSKVTAACTVYATISGNNLVKYYRNDSQYYATFLSGDGSPLANTNVTFNINGVFYTRATNASGVARLNINLRPDTYILTAIHPDTKFMYSNNITVLPTIISKDLTKIYRDSHQYYATFLDGEGSPLANTNVTFNINGVFYTRATNDSGVARLNINLRQDTYILTAYNPNDNFAFSSYITVIGSSSTTIETDNYTYYADDTVAVNATLYNQLGYAVDNQTIVLNVGNGTYSAVTDSNGVATFNNITLSPNIYTATYSYSGVSPYQSSSATNTITIRDATDTKFVADDAIIYYGAGETFNVTVLDGAGSAIVNQSVYFTINGRTYNRITDENGTAKLKINLSPGFYQISCKFNSTHYKEINKMYNITVINGGTSILTGQDITLGQGSGQTFNVTLKIDALPLPNRNVIFEINGVNYTRVTDENGVARLTINLGANTYLIKYYYLGEDRISPANGQAQVTVKARSETSLSWKSATSFLSNADVNLKVLLSDSNNKALSGRNIVFTLSSSEYNVTTDSSGIATLTKTLVAGSYLVSYRYAGDNDYLPSESSTVIVISNPNSSHGYGYWVQGRDMNSVDLAQLASLGTTDILLNFYAFTVHGESAVLSWIQSANSYGINVHIWMQAFYDGGWINPISGESVNNAYYSEKINEAKYYAGLAGVAGVHLDYLRYPGTAYKTSGGTDAITEFVKQVTTACREVNPNIIMSAAVMPETSSNIYYYGQDIPAITKYLDVIIPMQYKGNYNSGTNWLASTTKWFVQNSNGAEVWSGLQAYVSDDDLTKLLASELKSDAQTVLDNGADGVMLFRFGLSVFLDFNSLDDPSYGDEVTVDDVLTAATNLKNYIESNLTLPSKLDVGGTYYTVPQVLAMMTQVIIMMDTDSNVEVKTLLVTEPDNSSGDEIYSQLDDDEYIDVAYDVFEYTFTNNQAPNNITTSVGDVKYETLVYLFARVLAYYDANNALPAFALVNNFLDNPVITVNMLPSYSTKEYSYQNYTTSWLNYCPIGDHYGTLLVNPKGTVEGELTCYYCDSDFCGVTGHEKINGSSYVLTRMSESVPVNTGNVGDNISVSSIIAGAVYLKEYIEEYDDTPDYIVLSEGKYTLQEFLYLMGKAILQINASNNNEISVIEIEGGPSTPSGDVINSSLSKEDYLDVVNRVTNFIINNNWIPNYASSTVGKIIYYELLDSFSRILNYYSENGALPANVKIVYSGVSSKSISDLASSLIKGLTSTRDKAVALYNYVRDYISYSFYYNTQKGAEGTLTAGSGNCCDQAQLLVAMARSVNMTVRFATGYCTFSSGSTYGHVWVQFLIDGSWINADPTSTRNSFGVINNWNTASYTSRGTYDVLPY